MPISAPKITLPGHAESYNPVINIRLLSYIQFSEYILVYLHNRIVVSCNLDISVWFHHALDSLNC